MDTEESKAFVYPCLFSIHDMTDDVGLPSSNPEGKSVNQCVSQSVIESVSEDCNDYILLLLQFLFNSVYDFFIPLYHSLY